VSNASPAGADDLRPRHSPNAAPPSIGGLWVALVTPFRDGRCDVESLTRLCEHLDAAGVDGLLVGGTTGEGSLLSHEERLLAVHTAAEAFGDRVIAGAFGPSAQAIAADAHELGAAGARAVAVLPPPYVTLTADEMHAHYTAIANHSDIPVVLYNFLGQTPSPIPTDVALSLGHHPRIIGTKQSRPVLDADFERLICTAPAELPVVVGNPLLMLPAASLGARGAMLAVANVEAAALVPLWRLVADGDWAAARTKYRKLFPMLLAYQGRGPQLKQTLHERGLIASPELRSPLCDAGSAHLTTGVA